MRTLVFEPRSVYIYDVAKSLGFCFEKKRKTKTKRFCLTRSWKITGYTPRTNHSLDVSCNGQKIKLMLFNDKLRKKFWKHHKDSIPFMIVFVILGLIVVLMYYLDKWF